MGIIVAVVLIVFLFRPKAITDIARGAGQVVAEFRKGKREPEKSNKPEKELVSTAERLGIKTEGKTSSQLREEILAKAGHDGQAHGPYHPRSVIAIPKREQVKERLMRG